MSITPGDYGYVTVFEGVDEGVTGYYDDDEYNSELGIDMAIVHIGHFLKGTEIMVMHGQLREATAAEIRKAEKEHGPLWEGTTGTGPRPTPKPLTEEQLKELRDVMNRAFDPAIFKPNLKPVK